MAIQRVPNGFQKSATIGCPVAGIFVDVARMQAVRAMVPAGLFCRRHLRTAMSALKAFVNLGEFSRSHELGIPSYKKAPVKTVD